MAKHQRITSLMNCLKKNESAYLEDVMEKGQLYVNTEQFKEVIPVHATLIASMNVHDNSLYSKRMQNLKRLENLYSDFDFICKCNFPEPNTAQQLIFNTTPSAKDNFELLKQHLDYARTINPILNEQASRIISDHCMAQKGSTNANSNKFHEKLVKTTVAIARLNFKHVAGEQEINEAVEFIELLNAQDDSIPNIISPKEKAVILCVETLRVLGCPTTFNRLIQMICESDKVLAEYFGEKRTISDSSKARAVALMLKKHSKIQITKERPLELKYIL